MIKVHIVTLVVLAFLCQSANGFQIGPLGPKSEAKLTNEPESSLARAARQLGKIVKRPVHEEITQIAFDCPVDLANVLDDDSCAGSDVGYAHPFIMHGVRWNDVPPFRLLEGQGSGCKKFGVLSAPACNSDQTVRFSTQPDCWLCLFFEAQQVATAKMITGCGTGLKSVRGTLMTRSHFGDLQFLHAMAEEEGIAAAATRKKVIEWIEFAWNVFEGKLGPETKLKDVSISTIAEHFGCSDWTVSDLYILGRKDTLIRRLPDIAFGSVLHTVQDSFAAAHVSRAPAALGERCGLIGPPKPGSIIEFHAYGQQDGGKHDEHDSREAMAASATEVTGAIGATRLLFELWNSNAPWNEAKPLIECLFDLDAQSRPSSSGDAFRKSAGK